MRRIVDGFGQGAELLDQYFVAALMIAALLAVGTALRYALVTRLGERVVADIRKAVFDRVIGLSPAFYEKVMTGEIISRITTDTTLILSVISSSVSLALRQALLVIGGLVMLMLTSGKLTGLLLLLVPVVIVPIIVLGRRLRALSRENQDWIANSSGAASESLLAAQTVQAFTHEDVTRAAFADVTEKSFSAARRRITTRAMMTAVVIFLIFAGVTGVLWIGARDVRMGSMTVGELVQFVIYAVMVAGSVGGLSEVWGELQRAAGATERLGELLSTQDSVTDPADPVALPQPARGRIDLEDVSFHYPSRPDMSALEDVTLHIARGRDRGAGRAVRVGQDDGDAAHPALPRPRTWCRFHRRHRPAADGAGRFPPCHRAGVAGPGDLRRDRARQHPLRPPRCHRRTGGRRGQRRPCATNSCRRCPTAMTALWANAA